MTLLQQTEKTRLLDRRDLTDSHIREQAESFGLNFGQMLVLVNLQRRSIRKRKERKQSTRKSDAFQDEKTSGVRTKTKLTFQEQILSYRVAEKSGGKLKRPQTPEVTAQVKQNAGATKARGQDFDWFRKADDEDAEKIIRNYVPSNVRYSAVALAHQRFMSGEEGAKLWEKLRWTKRLRLCEEIHGSSF